ncbi:nitrogen regulation protein NR(I) [Castellaniella caeni]|uniref:nitrogen regulation protein NR(I) n=1 Tax=Castellaniella caeni TaxID=266123 RepID=UPI00083665AE|nr:nitrogen regulation protein NR(I) [Castellaniella caeni]
MKSVWIVDDEPAMRWVLERALGKAGWQVRSFDDGAALLRALNATEADAQPAVLVSDVRMPGADGLTVLAEARARHPRLPIILMTAYTDLDTTVAALSQGAFDYLAKPFDIQAAVSLIERAAQTTADAGQAAAAGQPRVGTLIPSASPAMQEVFRAIGRLARSSITVLITGESGTGKELVARALHQHSQRARGPFVAVNAAAIPRDLLEAELFGHERGAFTGATQMRQGRFEEARGGTLFLDEIGDMPIELQTRLLRVLAENTFYRVGGSHPIQVDVRVVAATHQPLEQRVAAGQFRADLFHRLNVIRLRLPALRERREDIAALCLYFLQRSAAELGVSARTLSAAAQAALQRFDYPGNIRQLENICQWLTVMTAGTQVQLADLPPEVLAGAGELAKGAAQPPDAADDWRPLLARDVQGRLRRGEAAPMDALRRDFEYTVIRAALAHTQGQRGRAAASLGLGRNTLTRKCQELGLDAGEPDAAGLGAPSAQDP